MAGESVWMWTSNSSSHPEAMQREMHTCTLTAHPFYTDQEPSKRVVPPQRVGLKASINIT